MVIVSDKDTTITTRVSETTENQLPDHINKSSLMRELLLNYIQAGDTVEVALQRKIKDKREQKKNKKLQRTALDNEIAELDREIEKYEQKLKERQQHTPEPVIEFAEKIKSEQFKEEMLEPDNPAVSTWSEKAGLSERKFIKEIRDRL